MFTVKGRGPFSPRPLTVFRSLRLLRDLSLPAAGVPRMRLSPPIPALPRPAFVVILSGAKRSRKIFPLPPGERGKILRLRRVAPPLRMTNQSFPARRSFASSSGGTSQHSCRCRLRGSGCPHAPRRRRRRLHLLQAPGSGKAVAFNVGWNADSGIFAETDKPYSHAD